MAFCLQFVNIIACEDLPWIIVEKGRSYRFAFRVAPIGS